MSSVEEHLRRWLAAGIIDPATERAIRSFEGAQERAASDEGRPGALEALVYLGVVVAAVGAIFLVGQNWEELESWSRISALLVPGLLAVLAGIALLAPHEPALQRAGQVAWLASVALLTGAVLVSARELGGGEEVSDNGARNSLLAAGLVALALSVTLWAFSPSHVQTVGIAASVFFLAQVAGNWPEDFDERLAGIMLFALGGAGLALATTGLFMPGSTGRVLFGALMAAGPYEVGLDGNVPWAEFAAFAAGAGLIGLSVARGYFGLTVAGVGVIFVALVTYVFEHFEDEIGAPVALMVCGGTVVAGVLLLVQLRGMVRQRRAVA